jgi:hypothetical protein
MLWTNKCLFDSPQEVVVQLFSNYDYFLVFVFLEFVVCPFVVFFRCTDSNYPFGIFKLF